MSRRPRLLFLTYTFPPAQRAGTPRVWNAARHLTQLGWDVTVVTPDPSLWRGVEPSAETRGDQIRRILTGHDLRWLIADRLKEQGNFLTKLVGGLGRRAARHIGVERTVGWIGAAERACSALSRDDVNLIFASGPPFSGFSLAQRLSSRLGCPYVLDYRDLWSWNLHHPVPRAARKEARLLERSAGVTIVSAAWASVLDREFGVGPKLHVISNGYDPEDLASIEPHRFGHFAIVYTGVFYPPRRVVSPLMAALGRLHASGIGPRSDWKFHYYGPSERHVAAEAERFGVTKRLVVHGRVPRVQALAAVKGAGLAVIVTSVAERATAEDNGMVTGKIFEAIGLGTPVLLIAPEDSDANTVVETAGLGRSFTASDVAGIQAFVSQVMDGQAPQPKDPAAYAWDTLAVGLDRVLRGAMAP